MLPTFWPIWGHPLHRNESGPPRNSFNVLYLKMYAHHLAFTTDSRAQLPTCLGSGSISGLKPCSPNIKCSNKCLQPVRRLAKCRIPGFVKHGGYQRGSQSLATVPAITTASTSIPSQAEASDNSSSICTHTNIDGSWRRALPSGSLNSPKILMMGVSLAVRLAGLSGSDDAVLNTQHHIGPTGARRKPLVRSRSGIGINLLPHPHADLHPPLHGDSRLRGPRYPHLELRG